MKSPSLEASPACCEALLVTIEDLARLVQEDPRTAWERFDDTFRMRLNNYARRRLTSDLDEARDLAQEAIVRLYQTFPTLIDNAHPERRIMIWLARICKNAWIDRLRKRQREQPLPEDLTPRSVLDPHRTEEQILLQLDYAHCLSKLPQEQRELHLRAFDGWTVRELSSPLE